MILKEIRFYLFTIYKNENYSIVNLLIYNYTNINKGKVIENISLLLFFLLEEMNQLLR